MRSNQIVSVRNDHILFYHRFSYIEISLNAATMGTLPASCFLHRNVHSRSAAKVTIATMAERGRRLASIWARIFTLLQNGWTLQLFNLFSVRCQSSSAS